MIDDPQARNMNSFLDWLTSETKAPEPRPGSYKVAVEWTDEKNLRWCKEYTVLAYDKQGAEAKAERLLYRDLERRGHLVPRMVWAGSVEP